MYRVIGNERNENINFYESFKIIFEYISLNSKILLKFQIYLKLVRIHLAIFME